MTVGAIEGTSALYGVAQSAQSASTSTTGIGLGVCSSGSTSDMYIFLQLLVAQMKYQDPMNPTDSADFLAQSAQFTALEKMQLVADQTGMLLGALAKDVPECGRHADAHGSVHPARHSPVVGFENHVGGDDRRQRAA